MDAPGLERLMQPLQDQVLRTFHVDFHEINRRNAVFLDVAIAIGELRRELVRDGIRVETSAPYTPEQNGVAERMNRTLVESARSMIL